MSAADRLREIMEHRIVILDGSWGVLVHQRRLSEEEYRRDVGAYFKNLQGTLNHLLVADRIWLWRMTATGVAPLRAPA